MWPALAMYDFLLHAFRDKGTVPGPRRSGWRSDGAQIPQMRVRIGLQRCPQAASARELRHQKCIESGLGNSTAMRRDPAQLANAQFDVLIIGGGAFGAAAAREAALHGLRTAIIERSDFGSGASSECFKMVHGGIRYLQHADIRR